MKTKLTRAAALTLASLGVVASQAASTYDCKVLEQNDASYDATTSSAISNKGHIVGSLTTTNGRFGVLWRGKQMQMLTAMELTTAVNDFGQVVGLSSGILPVMWWEGATTMLPALPSSTDGRAIPQGINNKGHVVGGSSNGDGRPWLGVLWVDGQIMALPFTSKYNSSNASAVNNLGDIAGTVVSATGNGTFPVIWARKSHKLRVLERLTPFFTGPTAINEYGLAAGYGNHPDGDNQYHAMAWKADGSVVDLGTLAGGISSTAYDINGAGVIVGGGSIDPLPTQYVATVWYDMSRPAIDLNTLVDSNGCRDGFGAPYVLKLATGVNNAGVITAYGDRNGNEAKQLAFRLTPQ